MKRVIKERYVRQLSYNVDNINFSPPHILHYEQPICNLGKLQQTTENIMETFYKFIILPIL